MTIVLSLFLGLTLLGSTLLALPEQVGIWGERAQPEVVFAAPSPRPVLALSIDDGPSSATGEILEVLERHGVQATFFLIGDHIRGLPEVVTDIQAQGHELGHHMMIDRPSIDLSPEAFSAEFLEMHGVMAEWGGGQLFRPGSGWVSEPMLEVAQTHGYRTVLGSIYAFDAQIPIPAFHRWFVREAAHPGGIIVLHDGPERGRRTAEILEAVLPALLAEGYEIVPVSMLLAGADG
jgi:peptidoglycan-N-acetylglucosamine deacetylase